MARTPSLSPLEAEAAAIAACGPRGTDEGARGVNFDTRATVRKWLVANGVASAIAQNASLAELKACWRDGTNAELNALRRKAAPVSPTTTNCLPPSRAHQPPTPEREPHHGPEQPPPE